MAQATIWNPNTGEKKVVEVGKPYDPSFQLWTYGTMSGSEAQKLYQQQQNKQTQDYSSYYTDYDPNRVIEPKTIWTPSWETGTGQATNVPVDTSQQLTDTSNQQTNVSNQQQKSFYDLLLEENAKIRKDVEKYKTEWERTQAELENTIKAWENERKKTLENPFLTQEQKEEQIKNINSQYGKLVVDTSQSFMNAFPQASSDIQKTLQNMAKAGFSLDEIEKVSKSITENVLSPYKSFIQQFATRYLEPIYKQEYMSTLDPLTKFVEEQKKALDAIPKIWKEYYYGTEEKDGYIQKLKKEAELEKERLNKRMEEEKLETTQFFDLAKQSLQLDLDQQLYTLEQQKTGAKKYLVGQLAKLGALNTSGAAAKSLTTLEEKYDRQISDTKTRYNLMLQEKELKYSSLLRQIENERQSGLAKINTNVSETERDIAEKMLNLEINTNEKKANLTKEWVNAYIETERIAIKEAKQRVEDYMKDWYNIASNGYKTQLLDSVLPSLISFKAEEIRIKRLKDYLEIQANNAVRNWGAAMRGVYGYSEKEIEDIQNLSEPPQWFVLRKSKEDGISYLPNSKYIKDAWQRKKAQYYGTSITPFKELPPQAQIQINNIQDKINSGKLTYDKLIKEAPDIAVYVKPKTTDALTQLFNEAISEKQGEALKQNNQQSTEFNPFFNPFIDL